MDTRKEELLMKLIDQHVTSAAPVSSGLLVDRYALEYSPATVRNDMVSLEDEGYISQPHTAAGRIPTEAGYRFYLQHLAPVKLASKIKTSLQSMISNHVDSRRGIKEVAKALAEYSQEAVVIVWDPNDIYYTGISHLFSKPEFNEAEQIQNLSAILDHFDSVSGEVLDRLNDDVSVLIGSDNPFSPLCSLVGFRYGEGAIILLGPMRMQYGENIALVDCVRELTSGK